MNETKPPHGTFAKVILILLGIIFLLPGACGSVFYGITLYFWLESAVRPLSGGASYDSMIITISAFSLLLSILLLGILMRFSRWRAAPVISLWLSILAVFVVITSHVMIYPMFESQFSLSTSYLFAAAFLALLVCAVPPYLHWRSNR